MPSTLQPASESKEERRAPIVSSPVRLRISIGKGAGVGVGVGVVVGLGWERGLLLEAQQVNQPGQGKGSMRSDRP